MAASATKRKRPAAKKATKATAAKKETKKDQPKEKGPSKREIERQRKAEEQAKVRDAKIKSGDLIVVGDRDFEKTGKDTKTFVRAQEVLKILRATDGPVVVADVAKKLEAFYEDVLPQFAMLEALGEVVRYEGPRRAVAYISANGK